MLAAALVLQHYRCLHALLLVALGTEPRCHGSLVPVPPAPATMPMLQRCSQLSLRLPHQTC